MSTTEQINAYLAWRSEREGRMVDVSPEAYERDQIIDRILEAIANWSAVGDDHFMLAHLGALLTDYYGMGE